MNWPNGDKLNDDELEQEEEEDEDCQYIDPNDIIIIQDSNNWKPSKEFIFAYASQLGFNADKDPKELINIAEKYLSIKLPENIKRAFMKESLQILYIDMTTQEIKIKTEIEEKAISEFEKVREEFKKSLKHNINDVPPPIINKGKKNNINNNKNINNKDKN